MRILSVSGKEKDKKYFTFFERRSDSTGSKEKYALKEKYEKLINIFIM